MQDIKKLTVQFVDEKIKEWTSEGVLGILATGMSGDMLAERSVNKENPSIVKDDVDGFVNIVSVNHLYVEKRNIKTRILN